MFEQQTIDHVEHAALCVGIELADRLEMQFQKGSLTSRSVKFAGASWEYDDEYGHNYYLFSEVYTEDILRDVGAAAEIRHDKYFATDNELGVALANIAAHEVGHSYGLRHVANPSALRPSHLMEDTGSLSVRDLSWKSSGAAKLSQVRPQR